MLSAASASPGTSSVLTSRAASYSRTTRSRLPPRIENSRRSSRQRATYRLGTGTSKRSPRLSKYCSNRASKRIR